ncbi:hypothetical protein BUALT_Bualt02G0193800 [Buddleja alternifolia]|uniref:Transmembrane protein n=1 Tax=Buddleja alternifolia TaxID=168488 RepID=A0AAV6Y7N8_9LAMI|nr:hypothetical protein BUALT_Bualt02G0193800 [Buddleja alternifolia]
MATNKLKSKSSSSSSSFLEFSTKPHNFFIFIGLLFILLALHVNSSAGDPFSNPSSMASSALPSRETLFADEKADAETVAFQYPRKRLNPPKHAKKSKGKEFEASDHEVPSGPNPISNSIYQFV